MTHQEKLNQFHEKKRKSFAVLLIDILELIHWMTFTPDQINFIGERLKDDSYPIQKAEAICDFLSIDKIEYRHDIARFIEEYRCSQFISNHNL